MTRTRPRPDATDTGTGLDAGTGTDDPGVEADAGTDTHADTDTDTDTGGVADGDRAGDAVRPRNPLRTRLRRAGAVVLTVALLLGGSAFFLAAHRLTAAPAAQNRALSDGAATSQVAGEIGNDLAHVFSYTPDGLDATERSARSVLTGRAARQYAELLARIRKDVTAQQVTLSTQAVRTGVIRLDGDDARLLVFLDQTSRRGPTGRTATAAAQLTVTAHRERGRWRIVDIKAR